MTPDVLRAALSLAADTFEQVERDLHDSPRCAEAMARNAARSIRALLDDESARIRDELTGPEKR
jgi:hypothetical protein